MKIKLSVLGMGICFFSIVLGCGNINQKANNDVQKITVFAASSMTEALQEIGDKYMAENKNVKIVYNFNSSGTLKTQIQEGATCDIFISAGQKQMDQLDIRVGEKFNPQDFVLLGSRFNILENKVVLVVPKNNPKKIKSFNDLVKRINDENILLTMGNSDVPVGQYSSKIFDFYKLDEKSIAKDGKINYGSNAKEVITQVCEGLVDAGIVYQTDATSAKIEVVDTATKEMCGQVIYPAAILRLSNKQTEAKKYLDFLKTDAASEVFKQVGFTPVK